MLSDDEKLFQAFQVAKNAHLHAAPEPSEVMDFDATLAGLRAVEAAVRADQIEKDAAIAHGHIGGFGVSLFAENYTAKQVETAIRAQLEGDSNAE